MSSEPCTASNGQDREIPTLLHDSSSPALRPQLHSQVRGGERGTGRWAWGREGGRPKFQEESAMYVCPRLTHRRGVPGEYGRDSGQEDVKL